MTESRTFDGEKFRGEIVEFHQRLGQFVLEFADTERSIFMLLYTTVGLAPGPATTVFEGITLHDARKLIAKIIKLRSAIAGAPDYSLIKDALSQLDIISEARNDILHNGLMLWPETEPFMTNALRSAGQKRLKEYNVSSTDLINMIGDLEKIRAHIVTQEFVTEGVPTPLKLFEAATRLPWRYKRLARQRPT
jgi:hypothetical protein